MRDDILIAVSKVSGFPVEQIKSKSMKDGLSEARGIYFLVGKMAGLSYDYLSEYINKTSSSAYSLSVRYQKLCEQNDKLRNKRDTVIDIVNSGSDFEDINYKPLWNDGFKILDVSSIYSGECYIGVVNGIPSMQEKSFHCLVNRMLDLISEKHE